MMNTGCTALNEPSPSPPAITQQFEESETELNQAADETPNNNNDNGVPKATDPTGHPQSHCAESTSIQPLTISSSQERMRDENSLRKGRKRKIDTIDIQRGPNGLHNMHPTELPAPHYISCYIKDRIIGKITCMICGEEGHYTCDCPMKNQENKVVCTLCNKVGHCYLWCCRQHVSENHACRRCGEKGHYTNKDLSHCDEKYTNMYVRCSSCNESHPLGRCPMGKVACFLCEGKDHVPAHCQLSPMLTATQYYRENFRAILKQALTETSRRAVTPAKLSSELKTHDDNRECQFKRNNTMVHTVSSFICCEQSDSEWKYAARSVPGANKTNHTALTEKELIRGSSSVRCEQSDCERKNAARTVPDSDKTNHAALTDKALIRGSSSACFNCHEEGHYANMCPKKKLPGEQELSNITCVRFRAKHKKKKLKLCDIICFHCHDKGHFSHSCPANKPPGVSELHNVTCINFDVNRCDGKKPPAEFVGDVTCFNCHDKGHYSYSCPKNKPPGQCHGGGHNAERCPKKKQKKKQQK